MNNNPFNPSLSHQIINNLIFLDLETIKLSYKHIFQKANFNIDDKTILYMTKQTQEFAYAFQLLGYHVWRYATKQNKNTISISLID